MKAKIENIDIKNNLKNKVEKINEARVLVIGDLMLDKFTYGDVITLSSLSIKYALKYLSI